MNIHLAGIESTFGWKNTNVSPYDNFLITYAYYAKTKNMKIQENQVSKTFDKFKDKKIMLDSGAFTRSNGIVDFTLEDYIKFLHTYGQSFFCYITLDIPMRGILTKEKISNSLRETEYNLERIEKEGLTPIPVYQRHWQDYSILEKYLNNYDYICIGGTATGIRDNEEDLNKYLDKVFDLNSKYKRKLHGLGQTQNKILKKYPFYSVDSTSWLQGTKTCTCYYNDMDKYLPVSIDKSNYSKILIEPYLFDNFERDTNYVNRLNHNIVFYKNYQRILQELWRHRGIDWGEYDKNKHFTN